MQIKRWLEIQAYLNERQEDAEVIRTGCLGMCNAEPVVSIQMPGRSRLFFAGITPDKVASLLDDVFHQIVPPENLIGQLRNTAHEPLERYCLS